MGLEKKGRVFERFSVKILIFTQSERECTLRLSLYYPSGTLNGQGVV